MSLLPFRHCVCFSFIFFVSPFNS
jgi:hypothetical protein